MRNPNAPPTEEQPADREPSAETVETAKKTVVEKSRAWADAGDALEAAQANQITPEQEARLDRELEAADLAFRKSLEELQQIAGIDVMLEVLDNLENLVAATEETDNSDPETPGWRPLA